MKSHIGPNGAERCKAEKGNCPFEADNSSGETNHFDTIGEARQEYDKRLEKAYGEVDQVAQKKRRLSEKEKNLLSQQSKLAKDLVDARAKSGEGITFDDANPERAKRRLNEAISYAESRHNEYLTNKLATSGVLPSGAFKMADGQRVNTDALLKKKLLQNHIESEKKKMIAPINEVLRSGETEEKKFQVKTDRGTYSLSVSEGIDEEAFDRLPKKLKDACSSEKESLNMDLARENIAPAKLREITSETQTLDYVLGKEPDVGQSELKGSTKLKGETNDEKVKSGLQNIADFYDESNKKNGKLKDMKDFSAAGSEAIKKACADRKTNTFIPARSQYNGALVSGRQSINSKAARELLSAEELKSITIKKTGPDEQKAQTILSEKDFGRIFKAKKASVRVTEKKD